MSTRDAQNTFFFLSTNVVAVVIWGVNIKN